MLVHTVYFWLKPDTTEENIDFFFKQVKSLANIKSVKGFHTGKPATTPPREVVDQSYDCGLTVILEDLPVMMRIKSIQSTSLLSKIVPPVGKSENIRRNLEFSYECLLCRFSLRLIAQESYKAIGQNNRHWPDDKALRTIGENTPNNPQE